MDLSCGSQVARLRMRFKLPKARASIGGSECKFHFFHEHQKAQIELQNVEFEKPFNLLSQKKISLLQDNLPSLEAVAQAHRPLVFIVEDINGEALAACILNKLGGLAVKAPVCANNRKSINS